MKKFAFTIIAISISTISLFGSELDSLIKVLDNEIENHHDYMNERELRIKGIKELLKQPEHNDEELYVLNNQLFEEYKNYIFDSAAMYLNKNLSIAESIGNDIWVYESKFKLSHLLSVSGNYIESMEVLEMIDKNKLPHSLLPEYYSCSEHLYNELRYHTQFSGKASHYAIKASAYRDSLILMLDSDSKEYLRNKESVLSNQGKKREALEINSLLYAGATMGSTEYAFITFRRAILYRELGNKELEKKFLVLSAISDVRSAIKENISLTLLAFILYEEEEIDKAYEYIKFSMDDAQFYNSRLRFIEISNILPLITQAYELKSERQKSKLRTYFYLVSLLTLILTAAFIYIYLQVKRLTRARKQIQEANSSLKNLNNDLLALNKKSEELNIELSQSNHIKEQYIAHFLSRGSNYIDKLNSYRRYVNKQLSKRKFEELFEETKSDKFIDNELKEYYDNFDNTFLHIYPDFVDELNSLLLEEERIVLKKGELLNTEIRIFALIRLGVVDSSKIAKLLRYSVNTIYNYRVKIKNKSAISRDEFENEIMKIGTFVK